MKALGAVVVVLVVLASGAVGAQDGSAAGPSLPNATFGKLPIYFIENRGVYPDAVAYSIQGADKTLFFTKDGITFRLNGKDRGWVVKLEFVGANPDVVPKGEDQQEAVFSYFKGPRKDWKTGLRTFAEVVYEDLWPGIDLVYRGTVNQLKYEFVVAPGADPRKIRLRYRGAMEVRLTDAGGLRVQTPAASFEDEAPVAYQVVGGERVGIDVAFDSKDAATSRCRTFGFRVGRYDARRPLVLDPTVLVHCGYIGGQAEDQGRGIVLDAAGNAYITGNTYSSQQTFPEAVGPDLTHNGNTDAFVAKVKADGTGLVYCGYIGGTGADFGIGIALDVAGNAYVAGCTESDQQTFPVTVGPDLTFNGVQDAFVAKLNTTGTALLYCGYLGGNSVDWGNGIAVDIGGSAYVGGETYSTEGTFPVAVGPDLTHNGNTDAFVAKVSSTGQGLVYCGFIGGPAGEFCRAVAVDSAGNVYVTGYTGSSEATFPVTVGPDFTYNGGTTDAFVAKVNPAGSGLVYCGYIGGAGADLGDGIALDVAGNAYVTGVTESDQRTFPVTVGPDLTFNGGTRDAFVAKVNPGGSGLVYCGYIGGDSYDYGCAIAVDIDGDAYVTGFTRSGEQTFPVVDGPGLTYKAMFDAFVAKVDATGTAFIYCGYIGGYDNDEGLGVAVDAAGSARVTGGTQSDERAFPIVGGPDLTHNGYWDAFVARVSWSRLVGSGSPGLGGRVVLSLSTGADAGLPYQVASAFGRDTIPIGKRRIELSPDLLLFVSISGTMPSVFQDYAGVLDAQGRADAAIHIPSLPVLIGVRLYSAFVTLSPSAPSGIRSISNTFMFSITK